MYNGPKFDSASTTRMIFDMVNDFINYKDYRASVMVFVCSPETGEALRRTECIPMEWINAGTASIMGCVVNACFRIPYGIIGVMDFDLALPYDDSFLEQPEESLMGESPLYKDIERVSPLPGRFTYENQYFCHLFPPSNIYQPRDIITYI